LSVPAFLDTGAIYAFTDRNDADREAVRQVYDNSKKRFVTHELVLVETFSLVTKRLHKSAAIQTVEALRNSSRVEVVPITSDLLQSGWERCKRYSDKQWDWIDCISFEIMERHGLMEVLGLDHHFVQAGFTLLV
jgi:predicted nucleic acid-binding protein